MARRRKGMPRSPRQRYFISYCSKIMLAMHKRLVYSISNLIGDNHAQDLHTLRADHPPPRVRYHPGREPGSAPAVPRDLRRLRGRGPSAARQREYQVCVAAGGECLLPARGGGLSRPPKPVSDYMAEIGRKGGKAKGSAKKRSTAHYK